MTEVEISPAVRRFVDFFGELGPRWGLPVQACRVHALLYAQAKPCGEAEMAGMLSLEQGALQQALEFLHDYEMIARAGDKSWRTSTDPWDAMFGGLEARWKREIPAALAVLRDCRAQAQNEGIAARMPGLQIGKMFALVEDLAALDRQAQRFSPQALRSLLTMSGRAARFVDRALGFKTGGRR